MGLDELRPGDSGIIKRIGRVNDAKLRRRLLDMGITSGERIEVSRYAPLGDPIEIIVKDFKLAIRKEDAKNITILREAAKW